MKHLKSANIEYLTKATSLNRNTIILTQNMLTNVFFVKELIFNDPGTLKYS